MDFQLKVYQFRIYRIVDPTTEATVYVGQTNQTLRERMTQHRSYVRAGSECPFHIFYGEVLRQRVHNEPLAGFLRIRELEIVTRETVNTREAYWIHQFPYLLNVPHNGEYGIRLKQCPKEQLRELLANWHGGRSVFEEDNVNAPEMHMPPR